MPQIQTNDIGDDQVTNAKLASTVKPIGVQDLFVPAGAWTPRVTNGCSPLAQTEIATSLINLRSLDFNQTTQQYAQFHIKFPRKWDIGTITFRAEWTSTTGGGAGVAWSLAGVALASGDALTTALGTAVVVTQTIATADTLLTTSESSAVTLSNTPASTDGLFLEISRVTGNGSDTLAADAKLTGVWLHLTVTAAKDA